MIQIQSDKQKRIHKILNQYAYRLQYLQNSPKNISTLTDVQLIQHPRLNLLSQLLSVRPPCLVCLQIHDELRQSTIISDIASIESIKILELAIKSQIKQVVWFLCSMKQLSQLKIWSKDITATEVQMICEGLINLEKLEIGKTQHLSEDMIKNLKLLKKLKSFGLYWTPYSVSIFEYISQHLPEIYEVSFIGNLTQFSKKNLVWIQKLKNLNSFNFSHTKAHIQFSNFAEILTKLPKLNKIDLSNLSFVDQQSSAFQNILSRIQFLKLDSCILSDESVMSFSPNMKSVKHLSLMFNRLFTFQAVKTIVTNHPQLQSLYLDGCLNIQNRSLQIISQGLPLLQTFEANLCNLIGSGIIYLRKLKILKKLEIYAHDEMEVSISNKLLVSLKKLKHIYSNSTNKASQKKQKQNFNQVSITWRKRK